MLHNKSKWSRYLPRVLPDSYGRDFLTSFRTIIETSQETGLCTTFSTCLCMHMYFLQLELISIT